MEALIIIDMQNYFISDEFKETFPALTLPYKIIEPIKNLLNETRRLKIPTLFIKTEYKKDKSNWPETKLNRDKLYCMEGTYNADIISELNPVLNESVFLKSRYSGFYETGLEKWLNKNSIDSIVLAGYALDGCIRFTAVDAFNVGIETTILSDCVLSSKEPTSKSIEYLQFLIQSEVIDSKQWLGKLPLQPILSKI